MESVRFVLISSLLAALVSAAGCQTGYPDTDVAADPSNTDTTEQTPDNIIPSEPVDDSTDTNPDSDSGSDSNDDGAGGGDGDQNEDPVTQPDEDQTTDTDNTDTDDTTQPDNDQTTNPDEPGTDDETGTDNTSTELEGWTLIWNDEFDSTTLNTSKWNHLEGVAGSTNNELQYYTNRNENTYQENGMLIIVADQEEFSGVDGSKDYTSASINTLNKGDFLYGRIEVKAKLAEGQGLWSAIRMLPTNYTYGSFSASGEINIVDAINIKKAGDNITYGGLQFGNTWPDDVQISSSNSTKQSISQQQHVYAIEWAPLEIRWYIDGKLIQTQTDWWSLAAPYPAPFDNTFYLALNIAVGGNLPGRPNSKTEFPQTMEIDYVRIYQSNNAVNADTGGNPDSNPDENEPNETVIPFPILQAELADVISGALTTTIDDRDIINFFTWGNYLQFNDVDFLEGADQIEFVVAQDYHLGYIEVRIDALDGPIIANLHVGHTDGWASFEKQINDLNQTISGKHTVYIIARHLFGAGDFDYFQFAKKSE